MDEVKDEVNYGLHDVLERKLVDDIYNSISYEIEIDEFEDEDYRKAALEACFRHIEDTMSEEISLKDISYRIEDRPPEQADTIAKNVEIEMDPRELARVYKQAYDEASVKADEVERSDHEKAIHFLIEEAIESNTFEKIMTQFFRKPYSKITLIKARRKNTLI